MSWLKPRCAALFLAVLAANSLYAALSSEAGSFVLQTYTPKTYGAAAQNWAIAQDARGVMYFGNTDGVLEFDGVFWRLIRLTYGSAVRSLGVDARGRIYVGGRGEFGYLEPDAHGLTHFVPLKVPKGESDFFDVWNVVPTPSGVYFGTDYKIFFRSNSGEIRVWSSKKRYGRIFAAYGELFVPIVDNGLWRLEGDDLVAGPKGDSAEVGARLTFAAGDHPVVASRRALFSFSLSEITPFANGASEYLNQNESHTICQLSTGDIAVGTRSGGLVLLDRQGNLERIIRKESGLTSDWVTAVFEDRTHALWLATNTGIVRFGLTLSSFGEAQGLHGSALCEVRFAGAMYVGTSAGAFRLKPLPGQEPTFEAIKDLHEQILVLSVHGNELLAGGDHGVYRLANGKAERLEATDIGVVYDIAPSTRNPAVFYSAGRAGVRQWHRVGRQWKSSEPVGIKGQEFRTVVEDPDGTVWSTTTVSIWHIDFASAPARVQTFSVADGVPSGDKKSAYLFRGHVVFATDKGLLRFDQKVNQFVPDQELGPRYADGARHVFLLREDPAGNVWITGDGYNELLEKEPDGGFSRYASPFIQVGADLLYTIFLDSDGTCWASDPNGALFRLEKLDFKQSRQPLPALLRRVAVDGRKDSLFGGDSAIGAPISLPHQDNALRFEYSAPFYDAPSALEYQYQLDGSDKTGRPGRAKRTRNIRTSLRERTDSGCACAIRTARRAGKWRFPLKWRRRFIERGGRILLMLRLFFLPVG